MKKNRITIVLLVSFISLFISCSKPDNSNTNTATSTILLQSNWRITYFSENGTDNTSNYNNWKFTFMADANVTIANDLYSIPGNWSTYQDDGRNNLLLYFNTTLSVITALNHDWHIAEKTSTKLRMEDVSGGVGGTDYLTLERN